MKYIPDIKLNNRQISSSQSIRKLLRQRWFVVILALMLTGLGAALTGVLFKTGIHTLDDWRLNLLKTLPAWFVLPVLGGPRTAVILFFFISTFGMIFFISTIYCCLKRTKIV